MISYTSKNGLQVAQAHSALRASLDSPSWRLNELYLELIAHNSITPAIKLINYAA